jgi:hypothetical protein
MFTALAVVTAAIIGVYLLPRGTHSAWSDHDRDEPPPPVLPADPWYRLVSDEFIRSADARESDPVTFAVVRPTREAEALARLERGPCLEVPEPEAAELAGRPLGGAGGHLVLLRALSWDTPYGGFSLSWRPGRVRVNHGCLGTRPLPMIRRAVVARLPDVPTEVFVDLGMAE